MSDERYLPTEKFAVPVKGGELALYRFGNNLPAVNHLPVLLIHGVTSSNRAFQLFAKSLVERGYVPYAVDLRGRGESNSLPGPFGMKNHARDMADVIKFIGVESIDVIGHSMGAFVAVALQGTEPKLVKRLILVDGGIPLPLPPGMTVAQVMPYVLGPAMTRLSMTFESVDAYRDYWKPQPAFARGWTPVLDEYIEYDLQGEAPNLKARTNPKAVEEDSEDLFVTKLLEKALENLTEDVLFIRAVRGLQNEEGGLYPEPVLAAILPKYPKVKVHTIADINHYEIMLEESGAEAVAQLIYGDK
jgi:pimeloyl-ACP methyl ester carboxylesterase